VGLLLGDKASLSGGRYTQQLEYLTAALSHLPAHRRLRARGGASVRGGQVIHADDEVSRWSWYEARASACWQDRVAEVIAERIKQQWQIGTVDVGEKLRG